jgi:hypothetical protein
LKIVRRGGEYYGGQYGNGLPFLIGLKRVNGALLNIED